MFLDVLVREAGASLRAVNWLAGLVAFALTMALAHREPLRRRMALSLLAAYVLWMVSSLVLNRAVGSAMRAELVPLWSYWRGFVQGRTGLAAEIVLNIALTVPLGFLAREVWPRADAGRVVLGVACLELLIELIQLVGCRGLFEWDDIINGTLGALLGCLLWQATHKPAEG